jgi:transcription termination factor Rho
MAEKKIDSKFLESSMNLRNIREERRKEVSKDSLFKGCKKKIQTTMIGALDTIEKQFGFLWSFQDEESMTSEQKQLKEIYEEARAIILDKGNTQIRNLESEFAGYDITKKRYQINLPVIKPDNQITQEGEQNG